jgi:hypothetical protein
MVAKKKKTPPRRWMVGLDTPNPRRLRGSYSDKAPRYVRMAARGGNLKASIKRDCSNRTSRSCRTRRLVEEATKLFVKEDGKSRSKRLNKAQWKKVFAAVKAQTLAAVARGRA